MKRMELLAGTPAPWFSLCCLQAPLIDPSFFSTPYLPTKFIFTYKEKPSLGKDVYSIVLKFGGEEGKGRKRLDWGVWGEDRERKQRQACMRGRSSS